jgi:lipopolysaccharide transport system permease protein
MRDNEMTIVYEPNSRSKKGLISTWIILINNIVKNRELIIQLFKRDFLMSYKKSFLGLSWLLITPVMGIISWVFMNVTGVLSPGNVGIPYPAYVLISTSIYGLFMGFFEGASGTLNAGKGFITQVNFPHDTLLIKQTLQQLANFIITFTITILVLLLFGVYPSWKIILLPLLILPMFFLGSAIGLITAVVSVVAIDIHKAIGYAIGLIMYITPVIYSPTKEGTILQSIIKWNPLTYLVCGVRDEIIYGKIYHLDRFIYCSASSLILFLIAWRIFYISEEKVIEKIM